MNKQKTKQTKTHRHRRQHGGHQREGGGVVKGKEVKYTVTEDFTVGGGHTMQHKDDAS